jgi:hypothetical protein
MLIESPSFQARHGKHGRAMIVWLAPFELSQACGGQTGIKMKANGE